MKLKKCEFMGPSVTYLGHKIDETGLNPLPDKIRAIQEAPTHQLVSELKSYLGYLHIMVNSLQICHPHCVLFTGC